jgi:3-phenylpropionate/trans-cinnamate dioxygenase ferredoxin subunit
MSRTATKHVVCAVDELPPGKRKIIDLDGRSIGVFNIEGTYRAIRNICPHHGAPLCLGGPEKLMSASGPYEYMLTDEWVLRCPWHGYEFHLETGRTVYDPDDMRVRVYPVTVEDGQVVLHD